MPKYRIVQVANLSEPKCFRVDIFNPSIRTIDYGKSGAFETAKDSNRWAFFSSLLLAEKYVENSLIEEANRMSSTLNHVIIKSYE